MNGRTPVELATYMREWRAKNPERVRELNRWHKLKYRYGLTRAAYQQMLDDQGGVCAAPGCDNTPTTVDHDHSCCDGPRSCGRCVRGLVCASCNRRDVVTSGRK